MSPSLLYMAYPKGKLCLDIWTILVILAVVLVFVLYYMNSYNGVANTKVNIYTEQTAGVEDERLYHRRIADPLLPPERSYPVNRAPIMTRFNTPARSEPSAYQQVGALIEETTEGSRRMLPLYGSRSTYNSNRWNYYANTDGFQSVKLPVIYKGKNCQDEFGCDEIYDNEQLNVQGFDFPYKATIYKVDRPRY